VIKFVNVIILKYFSFC